MTEMAIKSVKEKQINENKGYMLIKAKEIDKNKKKILMIIKII